MLIYLSNKYESELQKHYTDIDVVIYRRKLAAFFFQFFFSSRCFFFLLYVLIKLELNEGRPLTSAYMYKLVPHFPSE